MANIEDCLVEIVKLDPKVSRRDLVDAVWDCALDAGVAKYYTKADVEAMVGARP